MEGNEGYTCERDEDGSAVSTIDSVYSFFYEVVVVIRIFLATTAHVERDGGPCHLNARIEGILGWGRDKKYHKKVL
jgi:hypothetical protein